MAIYVKVDNFKKSSPQPHDQFNVPIVNLKKLVASLVRVIRCFYFFGNIYTLIQE